MKENDIKNLEIGDRFLMGKKYGLLSSPIEVILKEKAKEYFKYRVINTSYTIIECWDKYEDYVVSEWLNNPDKDEIQKTIDCFSKAISK